MKKVYIVIPVFNEQTVIRSVLEELHNEGYKHIIVVDDGSTDETNREVKRYKDVMLVQHTLNRGKGAAIKTGMEAAKRLGADVVVTFDGDGQHNPKDIASILKKNTDGYEVVLGSRFIHRQKVPFYKRIGNIFANFITYVSFGIWVTDSQSGLRGYTRKAITCMNTQNDRYEIESEALREIKRNKLTYTEVPMHARYTTYSQQKKNRQHIWSSIMTMIRLVLSD